MCKKKKEKKAEKKAEKKVEKKERRGFAEQIGVTGHPAHRPQLRVRDYGTK